LSFLRFTGFWGNSEEQEKMQYTYELREGRGLFGITEEMMNSMRTHVFTDSSGKTFEDRIEILFIMGDSKLFDLINCSSDDITNLRAQMLREKRIPVDALIKVYSKSNTKIPVLEIGRKKKIISNGVVKSC
jgi:hypothetical protein